MAWTLSELAGLLGATLVGDGARQVSRPVPAGTADPEGVTFADSAKYLAKALAVPIGAVIVRPGTETGDVPRLESAQPRLAFGALLGLAQRRWPVANGVHPTAVVAVGSSVDPAASVGPYCVVSEGATVAAGAVLRAFVFVGPGCRVGERTVLEPHAVLLQDVSVGADCRVLPGAVLGADGFGFAWDGSRHAKVPQAGGVVIGDCVEIGSNACVDRASCGETEVAQGVKLDNLVQVAHNVKIGAHTVVASQTGFSGSSSIGEGCVIGGQVGVGDHVSVAPGSSFGGQTGVSSDIDEPGQFFGTPARPVGLALRVAAAQTELPDLLKRVRALEAELERLQRDG